MHRWAAGLVVSALLWAPSVAVGHGGGLNACGCHFNRKTGECHCHRARGCGCTCEPGSCSSQVVPAASSPSPTSGAAPRESAGAPDFYLFFPKCQALLAGGLELKTVEGHPYRLGCIRQQRQVTCLFEGDGTEKTITYSVEVDAPPMLLLVHGQNGADFVSIDTSESAASSSTRWVGPKGQVGAKICAGVHVTPDVLEAFVNAQKEPREPAALPPAQPRQGVWRHVDDGGTVIYSNKPPTP